MNSNTIASLRRMTFSWLLPLLALSPITQAQQIYIDVNGTSPRPFCSPTPSKPETSYATPVYTFSSFAYSLSETRRTATSIPLPTITKTYAAPYESLSSLVPDLSTTTWGSWNPNATTSATDTADPYGEAAWTAQWERANPPNFTYTSLYSTTVSPTPVATSELILPPPEYFGPTDCYYFPDDFIFGVAGSAAQVEGAVAQEGRAPTLMEVLVQDDRPKDYVTNENYYLYKQDIERLAAMGVKYYSFSIAWTRILPFTLPGTPVNEQGLKHYDDLINFVLEKGMAPIATLLHFDTPLAFYGNVSTTADRPLIGYVNGAYQNSSFEDAMVNYGKIAFAHYGDRVPIWFTFNEPLLYSTNGLSVNSVVKAHARLYHFYHDIMNGTGKIGIKFNDNFGVPLDPKNQSDVNATNHFNSFQLATFANPIFLGLDYPDAFKQTIPDYVPLTSEDLTYINRTADFLGIDPYTATVVTQPPLPNGVADCVTNTSSPYFPYCVEQSTLTTNGWNIGYRSQSYVYTTPTYLRLYLNYLWNTFQSPVLVSEFGFPVFGEANKTELSDMLFDSPRSNYYLSFMSEILKAIWDDGVNVMGALAWSWADNWEFGDYDARFGLQTVNRTTQERRYKKSFFDLVDYVNTRTRTDNGSSYR